MLVIIYKISCDHDPSIFYIGSTKTPIQLRFSKHYRDAEKGSSIYFHRIMRERGLDNWSIEEIDTVECADRAKGYEIEYEYIKTMRPPLNTVKSQEHSVALREHKLRCKQERRAAAEYIREDVRRFTCLCGFFCGNPEVFMIHLQRRGRRHCRV